MNTEETESSSILFTRNSYKKHKRDITNVNNIKFNRIILMLFITFVILVPFGLSSYKSVQSQMTTTNIINPVSFEKTIGGRQYIVETVVKPVKPKKPN